MFATIRKNVRIQKMNRIILHIPHGGEKLPKIFWAKTILPRSEILQFKNKITDSKTIKLFGKNRNPKVVFPFSRIFCDVERFVDEKKEAMCKFGMGFVYEKTTEQKQFVEINDAYKNFVLNNFYKKHHAKLDSLTLKLLKKGKVILVDCHSFSKDIIMFDDKKQNLPDVCVGFNDGTNKHLVDFTCSFFEKSGLKVCKNYPYEDSMIPNCLLENKNKNFESIMIEINKNCYLNNKNNFSKMQKLLNSYLAQLRKLNLK